MIETTIETGRLGRLALIRLRPNLDLLNAVEAACAQMGFSHAIVRSGVGSLVDSTVRCGDAQAARELTLTGPGVEILSLAGEVRQSEGGGHRAVLRGSVADPQRNVVGGQFVRGRNAICITLELVLQEWLPDPEAGSPVF